MTYEDTYKNITIQQDTNTNDLYVHGKLNANVEQISPHNEGIFMSLSEGDTYTLTISTDLSAENPYFVELTRESTNMEVEVLHQESGKKPYSTTMISHYLGSGYSYSFTNDVNTVILYFNDDTLTMHGTVLTKQHEHQRSINPEYHEAEASLRILSSNHPFFPYV